MAKPEKSRFDDPAIDPERKMTVSKSKKFCRREFIAACSIGSGLAFGARSGRAPRPSGTPPKEDVWQIGCYTRPWAKQDYQVALDQIAEAGYAYAGLMTTNTASRLVISVRTEPEEAAQVRDEVKKRGLGIPSVWGGAIPVNESVEAGIAGLRKLIDSCAIVGAGNLLMGGVSKPELHDPYYKAITECCDYAAEKGIGISLKPHGGSNSTGPQIRATMEKVNCPNFRVWYDPGNIFFYSHGELDPVDDAAEVDGLVVGMSIKDYQHPRNVQLTPGTGKVDFRTVLSVLKEGGFTGGPLIVETLAEGDLKSTLQEAKKARQFVENLVSEI